MCTNTTWFFCFLATRRRQYGEWHKGTAVSADDSTVGPLGFAFVGVLRSALEIAEQFDKCRTVCAGGSDFPRSKKAPAGPEMAARAFGVQTHRP